MPYDDAILRNGTLGTDTDPLVPEPMIAEVIKEATQQSAILSQSKILRMPAPTSRQPVLQSKPVAFWRDGDTGLTEATKVEWENVNLIAEDLSVIVPIPRNYLDDTLVDVWSEVRPEIAEALALKLDQACIFGVGAPATFGKSLYDVADEVGNVFSLGVSGGDLASDVAYLGEKLEEQGYDLSGFMSKPGFQWQLERMRSSNGDAIYNPNFQGGRGQGLYGMPLNVVRDGAWDKSKALLIAGDFARKSILGIRSDVSWEVSTEAVISDPAGGIVYNLFQQRMVALKLHVRYAWATAKPVTALEKDEAARAPFAVLKP